MTSDPPPSGLLSILGPRSCPYTVLNSPLPRPFCSPASSLSSRTTYCLCSHCVYRQMKHRPFFHFLSLSSWLMPWHHSQFRSLLLEEDEERHMEFAHTQSQRRGGGTIPQVWVAARHKCVFPFFECGFFLTCYSLFFSLSPVSLLRKPCMLPFETPEESHHPPGHRIHTREGRNPHI